MMTHYSICSLLIKSEDVLAESYNPFVFKGDEDLHDVAIEIRHVAKPHPLDHMRTIEKIRSVIIMKDNTEDDEHYWVFKTLDDTFSLFVDESYAHVDYYYDDSLKFFHNSVLTNIFKPHFQLVFLCKLVQTGFSIFHAACVEINGFAFAFTGPSGIGKSSRARKWVELLSAEWISGDRPAIDTAAGTIYGCPWDGKESIYRNVNRPLAAILKVTRSETTELKELTEWDKMQLLYEQSFIPMWDPELAAKVMHSLKALIHIVPIFELCCDITDESTYVAYSMIIEAVNALKVKGQ